MFGLEQALCDADPVGAARTQVHALQGDGQQLAQIGFVIDN
jgi:hypothetical protein